VGTLAEKRYTVNLPTPMKLHRFIGTYPLEERQFTVHDPSLAHQLQRVLKLTPEEEVILADGKGNEAVAVISGFVKGGASFTVRSRRRNENEPNVFITLYLSMLKSEFFEFAAQKATEAGASRIIPVHAARTVKLGFRTERLGRIVKEAAEQSGRGMVPELWGPLDLAQALTHAAGNELNILFDQGGEHVAGYERQRTHTGIFIGPEGGWAPEELALVRDRGCLVMSLGRLTLRAETAATVASYLFAHPPLRQYL